MRFVGVNYRILEFYHTQFIRGYCIGLLLLPFELLYILRFVMAASVTLANKTGVCKLFLSDVGTLKPRLT